jgi:hypothetical protein
MGCEVLMEAGVMALFYGSGIGLISPIFAVETGAISSTISRLPRTIDDVLGGEVGRPEGIPGDWIKVPSNKGGRTKYVNPENQHDLVRVMPGNPSSPNPSQQRPYVVDQVRGSIVDAQGTPVRSNKAPEAHIPIEEFIFRR